jgi:hypothetical protein
MLTRSMTKIVLLAAVAMASMSPALAAKRPMPKMAGACSQPTLRCISDCDQFNWCQMNTCVNGKSTPVPLWRCFEPSGLCLAPHC